MIRPHNLEDKMVIISENLMRIGMILRVFRIGNFSEDTESEILERF